MDNAALKIYVQVFGLCVFIILDIELVQALTG